MNGSEQPSVEPDITEKDKKMKLVKKKYLTKGNSSVMIAKVTRDGKICRTNSAL